jgi:hypothetical protein
MSRPKILSVALVLALTTSVALLAAAQARPLAKPKKPAAARADTAAAAHRVVAYYFHTNFRCVNCRRIEAYSREAVEAAFPQELKDGRLIWKVVNVEEKGNEHFVKDYQLYTKSLVLVDEAGGKRTRWKNCTKVWEFLSDKEGFLRYVQGEVRGYLTDES